MAIDKELLDQLLDGRDPQELFARDGLIDELKKALSERMLGAELDDHLGSEAEAGGGNRRNGSWTPLSTSPRDAILVRKG